MNQKGLALILIVILVVVVATLSAIGGHYVFNNLEENARVQREINESLKARQMSPSPTPNETANWKTYTNTPAGYSLKYPTNLLLKEVKLPSSSPDYSQVYGTLVLEGKSPFITIYVTVAESSKKLELDHILGNGPQFSYISDFLEGREVQKIKLDNVDGVRVDGIRTGPGNELTTDLMVIRHSIVYEIILLPSTGENLKVLQDILATFKFAN